MSDVRSQTCSTCAGRDVPAVFATGADRGASALALLTIARCSECGVRLLDLLPRRVRDRVDEFREAVGVAGV